MNKLWHSKLIAFSIHLIFSALIISMFMALVTQFWFPDILFELENVWQGLNILIPVDAILGPLLTLILFVPGKKGMKGDLIIIATIQVLALAYGGLAIYGQRPEVIAFTGDRFEIIPSSKFNKEQFAKEHFLYTNMRYPLIVYALPAQTKEGNTEFIKNNVQYQKMSERYRPLADYETVIRKKSLLLAKFSPENEASKQVLTKFKAKYKEHQILLFVLEGTTSSAKVLVLDRENLQHLGYLDLDPWTDYKPLG